MLLRQKKTQGEENNWCVILRPLENELDRKRVAQKISAVFSLSAEEALDLVCNTPIILLDNLTRPTATRLKEYFQSAGAQMLLTNDTFQKRKCYRTVWPEPPNLAFLNGTHGGQKNLGVAAHQEPMDAEAALQELRAFVQGESVIEDAPGSASGAHGMDSRHDEEREKLEDELARSRRECLVLREQAEHLKEEMARWNEFSAVRQDEGKSWERKSQEQERQIRDLRTQLAGWEEKCAMVRDEYREARSLYEEKISLLARESEQWKTKMNEMSEALQAAQREKQNAQLLLQSKEEELRQKEKGSAVWRQELDSARDGAALWQAKHAELEKTFQANRKALEELAPQVVFWRESQETVARQLEELGKKYKKTQEELNQRVQAEADRIRWFETQREELDRLREESRAQMASFRHKQESLTRQLAGLEEAREEERKTRESMELREKDLEKSQIRLMQELEKRSAELRLRDAQAQELERQAAELREACENQQKIVEAHLAQIESREKELENARRQLKELHAQVREREAAEKRSQLAGLLAEKEALLKRLVQEQEKMESEIRHREESMRRILEDQESVEKEILEAKQTQRHLLEQSKKERNPRFRIAAKGFEEAAVTEGEPESHGA